MALSDQLQTVRSWFASTPGANPNPSEEDLKYYAEQGINKFLSDVASVRAASPQVASSIDQQRAAMMPFGSVTGSLFTGVLPTAQGGLPGVSQGNYVPFSALLQPYGSRGYGNYGYGPGMMMQPAMQPPAQPSAQPPAAAAPAARPSPFPAFDLSSWYNPSASTGSLPSTGTTAPASSGMMGDQNSTVAALIAALQAALQGPRTPTTPTSFTPQPLRVTPSAQPATPAAPAASDKRLEDIRLAFQSIPGANPNPDQAALEYYASQGIDKLKADVAFIRQANPGLAAQIDAERAKLGLS